MDSFRWKNFGYIPFYLNIHKKNQTNKQRKKEKENKFKNKPILGLT